MNLLNTATQYLPLAGFIGTYLLIIANDRAHLVERVKKWGIKTEGTVVDLHQNPGSLFSKSSGEGVAPVVDFSAAGATQRHYSTQYMTPSTYRVGQKVEIWYYFYKSKREVALADEDGGPLPSILFRWGLALCLIGYPFLFKRLLLLLGW